MVEVCAVFFIASYCLETIDVCKWCMFVFMTVVLIGWGYVGMFVV